ncbi:hypothetical protein ACFFJY_02105 [Fictibacillus aquaticus]|uniref:Uncharacterized protein n=1 Tax=Fictibacillus aquaticus TaxID=2021314 RepID=A0A235F909_9BACL|nr:hypothetical protein [Fictibacillus aquaticus]OYD57503.1 hypothetical protein CGZ90_12565 [Fictibacillus aquaticus]
MEQHLKEMYKEAAEQYPFSRTVHLKKKKSFKFTAAAGLAACCLFAFFLIQTNILPGKSETIYVEQGNSFDVSNPHMLSSWADNIFIGEVVKKKGSKSLGEQPETQYVVEVMRSMKGNLNGQVTVNQLAGYNNDDLSITKGDNLLKEGQKYLFVTRYLESEDWYTTVPVYGNIKIEDIKEEEDLAKKYEEYAENPIPFE